MDIESTIRAVEERLWRAQLSADVAALDDLIADDLPWYPRPMRRLLVAACLFATAAVTAGCRSPKDGARDTFAREFSCPQDRVDARERTDVTGSSLLWGPPAVETPPPEVARDASRLAKWKADQAQAQQATRDTYDSFTVLEVNGCGHRAFYACKRSAKVNGNADPIGCFPGRFPPP